ncbi:MAG TPA: PQQ-binding-like beta-propeller repeat protein [Myxococcaceae bacterium]|nr:PQQ-binding-like beta-propeller repeat protein [Myxococcaceae bacterium]
MSSYGRRGVVRPLGFGMAALLMASACGGQEANPTEAVAEEMLEVEPLSQDLGAGEVSAAAQSSLRTRWARRIGTGRLDEGRHVAVDAQGNVVTAVERKQAPDEYTEVPVAVDLVKFNPNGTRQWTRSFVPVPTAENPNPAASIGALAVVEGTGDVLLGGSSSGSINLAGQVLTGGEFLARLTADGNLVWARNTRPEPFTGFTFESFAVGRDPYFYAATFFSDSRPVPWESNIMVIKYSIATGLPEWSKMIAPGYGGMDVTSPKSIAVDDLGNRIVISARTTYDAGGDGRLYALDDQGRSLWTWTTTAPTSSDFPYSGSVDSVTVARGTVVASVRTPADFTFNGRAYPKGNYVLAYVADSGAELWAREQSSTSSVSARGEEVLAAGSGDASRSLWVTKLNRRDGSLLNARVIQAPADSPASTVRVLDAAIGADGQSVVSGAFVGPFDFGTGPLNSRERDAFVVRLRR